MAAGGKKGALLKLRKELQRIHKEPPSNIQVAVQESNMLEWHYLLEGPDDTPYAGGWYHGKLKFPPDYPYKPPGISMFTPSGRFEVNMHLCLSMSDYHPETWNPGWSVATVLTGLLSFMTGDEITTGSVQTSDQVKKLAAKLSMEANMKNATFVKLFPGAAKRAKDKERDATFVKLFPGAAKRAKDKELGIVSGPAPGVSLADDEDEDEWKEEGGSPAQEDTPAATPPPPSKPAAALKKPAAVAGA
ncbi:ubiquitin-conjugating enzyme/RWD-like protein [Baffinella frigidus]|nr:ubiquitin-conjugating enzyme/RWD-like protein [Cryptophyta sp. CCMP2293]